MSKINLRHFLVTNVAGIDSGTGSKTGPKNIRYFNYEKPEQATVFFGLLIFPAAFTATGLLEKLLTELKSEFDNAPVFDEIAFEKIIGFFNNKLRFYAGSHKNQKDLAQFDICLAATFGAKLVFAPLGNISAILFVPEAGHSRYYNLIKEAKGLKEAGELLKLKEIIAGNLSKNNSLIICNEELLDIYSFADLEKLITRVDSRTAATNLQTALLTAKVRGTFAGFILETIEATAPTSRNSASSMKEMIAKRQETTKIIEATAPIDIKRAARRAQKAGGSFIQIIKNIGAGLWRFVQPLAHLLLLFLIALTNWNNRGQENWEAITEYLDQEKEKILIRLRSMSWQKKIIFVLALSIVLFFGVGITRVAWQNRLVADANRFKTTMEKISNLRTDAEVAFIQANNKEQSRQLLENALSETNKIKTKNPDELAALQGAREQIQNRLFTLWKMQAIILPKSLASLDAILPNEKIANAFSADSKQIFAWSAKRIFIIQNGAVTASFNTDEELQSEFNFNNGLLTIKTKNQNRLVQLSVGEQKIYVAEIDEFKDNLVNFTITGDKLYALSNENLFITKHLKSLTGFARGTGWLRDPIDVKEAIDLTVDGSLYALFPNGQIKKMYNGRLSANFNQEYPEPKLNDTEKIWTSENTKFLFVENTADARLILYDKNGAVVLQLKFSNLPALKNFYVNDATRIPAVSLFDGANVYYLSLEPYL